MSRRAWTTGAAFLSLALGAGASAAHAQATVGPAPPGTKPPAPPKPLIRATEEQIKRAGDSAKQVDDATAVPEMLGELQQAAGAAHKKNKSVPGPKRYSQGDKTINSGKKMGAAGKAVGVGAKVIDNGAKALTGDVGGLTENAIEEGLDKIADTLCSGKGPVITPACKGWYELTKMAGREADRIVKEKTGTGIRDRMTDVYYDMYEYSKSDEARYNLIASQTGMHPDQVREYEEKTRKVEEARKAKQKKGGDCTILQDPTRSRELADRDSGAWMALQQRCE